MNKLIDDIDKYLSNIKAYIDGMIFELDDLEYNTSSVHTVKGIIYYFKNKIDYNIYKYEVLCIELREKLNESEIL